MSSFEDFARRSKLDLNAYFTANNIKSDEDLTGYCKLNNIGLPEKAYFKKEEVIKKKPKPKTKAVVKEKNKETKDPVPKKTTVPKKTKTTRSRTRKTPVKK